MYIFGCFLQSAFTLACGLARTPFQLILFRALAGIAIAFCLPSAVSLITTYFPHGRRRNMAFAAMGGGQPVGFSIGLTVGGVLVDSSAGWRAGFYVAAGINTFVLVMSIWGLPKVKREDGVPWDRLRRDVDWTGAILLSSSLGVLSYVFAALTGAASNVKRPTTIALLVIAVVMMIVFIFWVGRQERLGRPAIIPNSLWRNRVFTSVCLDVFFLWGAFNATETLLTFFFQEVQMLNATKTSIRFLPAPVVGVLVNGMMGLIIHRVRANWAIIIGTLISCISPILTALMKPSDSYWEFLFPSIALNAIGPDVLFTASNLIITDAFPDKTQALAGGVFNTVAQIGKSVGLALSAVIANSVSMKLEHSDRSEASVLLEGYRAAWWFILSITALTLVISLWGLRHIGKLGLKRE
jgi:MFS family permease